MPTEQEGVKSETVKDFGKKGSAETKQKTKMVNTKKIPCAKQGCKGKLTDNHGACGMCGTKRLTPIICSGCEATITESVRCCTTCGTQISLDPMEDVLTMTVIQLKELCGSRKLLKSGTSSVLASGGLGGRRPPRFCP